MRVARVGLRSHEARCLRGLPRASGIIRKLLLPTCLARWCQRSGGSGGIVRFGLNLWSMIKKRFLARVASAMRVMLLGGLPSGRTPQADR